MSARILYIEDSEDIAQLVKAVVEKHGYSVDTVATGVEGLALHEAAPYDAVAVDYQLPDMNGIDICRQLLLRDPELPIVMVTGKGSQRLVAEALTMGVSHYVQKDSDNLYLELLPSIIPHLVAKTADIKKKRTTELELRKRSQQLEYAARLAQLGFWEYDELAHRTTYMSQGMYTILGFSNTTQVDDFYSNQQDLDLIHPDDQDAYYKRVYEAPWIDGDVYEHEYRIIRPDGQTRYLRQISQANRDEHENIVSCFGVEQDVTDQRATEFALRDSQARASSIIRTAVDGIITISAAGIVDSMNTAAETMFGYEAAEVMGKNVSMLMPEPDRSQHDGYLKRYLESGMPRILGLRREVQGLRKNGEVFAMSLATSDFSLGKELCFAGIVRDISQAKQDEQSLRQSREQFSHAAKVANLCHWRADASMSQWLETSENTSQIIGTPADELLGNYDKYLARIHPDDRDMLTQSYAAIGQEPQPYELEYRVIGDDGMTRYLWEVAEPEYDEDGTLISYRGTTQNVTDRKVAEREAIVAKEAADRANLAKSEFLSSMSHELRTPLNAILGFGQMLEYNPKEPLSETQQDSVNHILKGGQHLLDLINEVLNLAKIEAGHIDLSLEDIAAHDVLEESVSLIASMAESRGITINKPSGQTEPLMVLADHTRLKQILLNLLSNAIKYNREGGRIEITCERTNNHRLHISVSDTGKGIPADKQDELFQPFSRLGAEHTEIEGTGIGLTVTKKLVEFMNGAIGLESTVGEGSTFWIELPLVDQSGQSRENIEDRESVALDKSEMRGTLLYVEDNPANLKLMETIIGHIGGLVMISAHNAELGLELARTHKPDIIILDINLPGMSGLEAMKRLKEWEETAHLPILALSAAATPHDIERGIEAGFDQYLTKPIQVAKLISAISDVLEDKDQRD